MRDQSTRKQNGWSRIVQILLVPVYTAWLPIGLVILFVLAVYAIVFNIVRELRFRAKVRREGRYVARKQLADLVSASGGTIIIESPTLGWRVSRAWWTPDDVLSLCPTPPPKNAEQGHPFYEWAYGRYISSKGGTALLFGVWNGSRRAAQLGKRYPTVKFVNLWSGSFAISTCQGCGVQFSKNGDVLCPTCGAADRTNKGD